jgi:prolyl oligopeptidase
MLASSPDHTVKDGAAYPATLFLHGDNDPRVAPWQSRKMTARLQAATSSSAPILLRTHGGQGHVGASLDAVVERDTDVYSFLFHELGVEFKQGTSGQK